MTTTVVRKKGQITIPVEIRGELGIEENDTLTLTSWDKRVIIIIPQKLKTVEVLKEAAALAKQKGLTLEEMLAELDEIRHKA